MAKWQHHEVWECLQINILSQPVAECSWSILLKVNLCKIIRLTNDDDNNNYMEQWGGEIKVE